MLVFFNGGNSTQLSVLLDSSKSKDTLTENDSSKVESHPENTTRVYYFISLSAVCASSLQSHLKCQRLGYCDGDYCLKGMSTS